MASLQHLFHEFTFFLVYIQVVGQKILTPSRPVQPLHAIFLTQEEVTDNLILKIL
jgi:hypothetical protein